MKLSQAAYEVLSVIVTGEATLQSLAHSLKRFFQSTYEVRTKIASKSLLQLAQADCIRWDFYDSYGNSRPKRTSRSSYVELLEDLAETDAFLQEVKFQEDRDDVTISIWVSKVGLEILEQLDEGRLGQEGTDLP